MKRLALAAFALLASHTVFAQAAPKPPELKLAVVNVGDVYNNWEKVKDFTKVLEEEKKTQEAELEKMQKDIKEKIAMRDTQGVGAKLRQSLTIDIVRLQAEAEYRMKSWNDMVKERLDSGIAVFYNEMRDEIAAYAKENGFTMVLKAETGKVEDLEDSGVNGRINRRGVLYFDDGFDITKDIVKRLNDKYAKEKPPGQKDPEPPKDGDKAPKDGEKK